MDNEIKVQHEFKDGADDPYGKLMEQIVREDDLEGIIIITVQHDREDKLSFGTRTRGRAGQSISMFGEWATQGIIQTLQELRRRHVI